MISKFNHKLEYQIKIGKLSITRFADFCLKIEFAAPIKGVQEAIFQGGAKPDLPYLIIILPR